MKIDAIFSKKSRSSGFTIIEMVVMVSIVVVVSGVFIGGFPLFNQRTYVKKEAQRLALNLRSTQSNAILGKVANSIGTTPTYWGIHADIFNPTRYLIFADVNANHQYNSGVDEVIKTVIFENGIKISGLASASGGESEINFFFSVPYGDTEVWNGTVGIGSFGQVTISAAIPGITQNVVIMRVSGQIVIN